MVKMEEDFKFAALATILLGFYPNIFNVSHFYEELEKDSWL